MDSLGPPISPLALADGTPVYDRAGERIGVVDHVMSDERSGIFEGLIVHTRPLPGRHVYAHHDQIAAVHERGVVLAVEREDLHEIEERRRHRDRSVEPPEPRLEAILRRAWDWVNGFS
jgi:sporulation protein YlmC with PRC-barrel domain